MSNFFPYIGGKKLLAKRILARIPQHTTYVEAFLGSGTIFLVKQPSEFEVLNDISNELVTLWRVVREHLYEFAKLYTGMVNSRAEFARLKETPPDTLTDIQKAVRFYFLIRAGYAGRPNGVFTLIAKGQKKKLTIEQVYGDVKAVQKRLRRPGLTLENRPWDWIIERCDSHETFFYLDPPYWGSEDYYGKALFPRSDFERLANILSGVNGRFILSLNDVPEIRSIFGAFEQEMVNTRYSAGATHGASKKVGELLISNFITRKDE